MTVILKTVNLKSVVIEVNKKLFCHSLNYSKETIRQHSYCGVAVHNGWRHVLAAVLIQNRKTENRC